MNHKLFYYFSKIDPSENKFAAKSLSERFRNRNMRRVKVNAQVTSVITLLEAVGNCVSVIFIFISVTRLGGHGALAQTIVLYFVILPYAFLMNTKHN